MNNKEQKNTLINPPITQEFLKSIKERKDIERIELEVGTKTIFIDNFPCVFPAQSDFSISTKVCSMFGDVSPKWNVAEIGSGTGFLSILIASLGVNHVDACDINPKAVKCSKHNVQLNKLTEKIDVFYSDLFSNFPRKKYDLIIANLPIVNFKISENNIVNKSFYDDDFKIHKKFFKTAKNYLTENGFMSIVHANLQSKYTDNPDLDFEILENLIEKYGYEILNKNDYEELDYKWINYKIKCK